MNDSMINKLRCKAAAGSASSARSLAIIILSALAFLSVGCANNQRHQQQLLPEQQRLPKQAYVVESYKLEPFNTVIANGNFVLELTNGVSQIAVGGQKQDIDDLTIKVKNNTLYLDNAGVSSKWRWRLSSAASSPPVVIKLRANDLRSVVAKGQVCVSSENIIANNLNVIAYDNATFVLDGRLNITKIVQMGTGKLEAKWIESKNLMVLNSNKGPIYLAGVVDAVAATLTDSAYFDARYLRARRAAIFTTDVASANVLALKSLDIYADKHSNVFYYKRPKQLDVVTKDSGNALLMEELS